MIYVKVAFAMLIMASLASGAAQIGMAMGFDEYWAWWFATAVFVGAVMALDPQSRRNK